MTTLRAPPPILFHNALMTCSDLHIPLTLLQTPFPFFPTLQTPPSPSRPSFCSLLREISLPGCLPNQVMAPPLGFSPFSAIAGLTIPYCHFLWVGQLPSAFWEHHKYLDTRALGLSLSYLPTVGLWSGYFVSWFLSVLNYKKGML